MWVCDKTGVPICKANSRKLTGATQEEVRDAQRKREHLRRIAREYAPKRDFLHKSRADQIQHVRAERAAEAANLPKPAEPAVTVRRPDLIEPVKTALKRQRRRQARELATAASFKQPGTDVAAEPKQTIDDMLKLSLRKEAPEPCKPCAADLLKEFSHAAG